jgi:hypothetical protein
MYRKRVEKCTPAQCQWLILGHGIRVGKAAMFVYVTDIKRLRN